MVRTRTIREAAAYFREGDPNTSLTETAIRTLIRTGAVPSARVGKKYLVSLEALENYLTGDPGVSEQNRPPQPKTAKTWRIQ